MKLKELLEESLLTKGGFDTISYYAVRNAIEKFIRKNYTADGGLALKTLDNIASDIQKSINNNVYALEDLEKKYNNSMSKWVDAHESRIRDLIYSNI